MGGGGSGGNPGENFSYRLSYSDGRLPDDPLIVTVSSISVRQVQHLEAQWAPPAASTTQLPTPLAVCLTSGTWKAAFAQKPSIPNGLGGRVLVSGQLDKPGSDRWSVVLSSLDGTRQQVIQDAQDGAISPDGTKLAYSTLDKGLGILDLTTSQTSSIPGTGNGDFNPLWSPDGKQMVFNRGMGIFDLFIVEPDGSNMRQITHGGVQEWPVGWLPDGRLLYTVPGRENEFTNYAVDIHSGHAEVVTDDNLLSLSPGGKYVLTSEKSLSDRWQVYISELNGANRRLLNDSTVWILTSIWSPDDQWLLASISDNDRAQSIVALINLNTCQVIPVPNLQGNLLSWTP
jgi:Tol biopolymer transport system component